MYQRQIQGIGMTSQRTRNRLVENLRNMGITNKEVLEVIASTPRHLFIDEALSSRAYENVCLPIGHAQTISQPYVVAKMTELLLADEKPQKVLEVGTGSGYQTAILSPLIRSVYTVERIKPLLEKAQTRFRLLKLNNILTHYTDGHWGWKSKAPYDAMIVTAAPETLPSELLDQLVENARIVSPIGPQGDQHLHVYQKIAGNVELKIIEPVSFVPLVAGKI